MEALLISQKEGVHASMGIGESAFMSPEGGFVHPHLDGILCSWTFLFCQPVSK